MKELLVCACLLFFYILVVCSKIPFFWYSILSFYACVGSWDHHHRQDTEHFHHPPPPPENSLRLSWLLKAMGRCLHL